MFSVSFFIAVSGKLFLVSKCRVVWLITMLYATPVIFGAPTDVDAIGKDSVQIRTVGTLTLSTVHAFQAIKPEPNCLIKCHALMGGDGWNEWNPDEGE